MTTPKEAYIARRKAREQIRELDQTLRSRAEQREQEMDDLLDRFVMAVERIAVALEKAHDTKTVADPVDNEPGLDPC